MAAPVCAWISFLLLFRLDIYGYTAQYGDTSGGKGIAKRAAVLCGILLIVSRPIPFPEHGHGSAVPGDGVDAHVGGADHEVYVEHRIVDAQRATLVQSLVLEAPDRVGIAHAQGQVTGGVLVEQCVVEQYAVL